MFIEYTDECYGCKDRSEVACDKCIEKKIALDKLREAARVLYLEER